MAEPQMTRAAVLDKLADFPRLIWELSHAQTGERQIAYGEFLQNAAKDIAATVAGWCVVESGHLTAAKTWELQTDGTRKPIGEIWCPRCGQRRAEPEGGR